MDSLLDSRPTAIATVVVVFVLFAALFFIVTTPSMPLLMLQLSSCSTIVLLSIGAWALASFEHLSHRSTC